jgi:hypothetical protein
MPDRGSIVYWNWQRTVALAVAVLAVLQIFRANRPDAGTAVPPAPRYTTGTIVDAAIELAPHEFVSYKAEFNRRTKLTGDFQTGQIKVRVECLVLDEANFEAWRSGQAFKSISATGYVPGGRVVRVLEPGIYYVVISNRDGGEAKVVNAKFAVE